MKRSLLLVTLFLCFGLSSCQCSEKPPIGPVEDEQAQVLPAAPSIPLSAPRA
jgi:hypothetical protein